MSKYQIITQVQPSKWILPVFMMFHGLFGEGFAPDKISTPGKGSRRRGFVVYRLTGEKGGHLDQTKGRVEK